MITTHDMLWGVVLPFLLSAILVPLSAFPRRGPRVTSAWGLAVALAGGFTLAYFGITGKLRLPPKEAEGWLPHFAMLGALASIFASLLPRQRSLFFAYAVITVLGAMWLLLRPVETNLPKQEFFVSLGVVAAGGLVWWFALERLATRVPGALVAAVLFITSIATALVLMNSGTQRFGQLSGSVAVVLAAALLLSWWLRLTASGGAVVVSAVLLPGLIVAGHFYAEVTTPHALILAAAPISAWLGQLPGIRSRRRLSYTISLVAVLAVLTVVLIPTIKGLHQLYKEQTESTYYE
ncbi:MAG TPA: hypothetical protein VF669_06285 [Tepidisphaeraceae bacterium]